MPSYTIPEDVIGIPLFVPAANDFFQIEAGGMPNGDPCLVVRGDLGRNYKAYQPVQTVSPDLFRDSNVINWAMSMWLKLDATANLTQASFSHSMITCQTIASTNGGGDNGPEFPYGNDGLLRFGVWAKGTSGIHFGRPSQNVVFQSGAPVCGSGNLPVATWQLVTINVTSTINGSLFLNDNVAATSSGTGVSWAGGSWAAASNFFFCIGAYSNDATASGRDGVWRIGKLGFHNHGLNATERSLLYHSMVG